jgi:hypothetical protein
LSRGTSAIAAFQRLARLRCSLARFCSGQDNDAACRLAPVSTIEHVGVPTATKPRVCVPNKKDERNVAGEVADKSVLDAALINAAQAAEHYEIARYASLIAWAKQLGRNDCASVLQKTLEEEKATDKKLTELAESKVNLRALRLQSTALVGDRPDLFAVALAGFVGSRVGRPIAETPPR